MAPGAGKPNPPLPAIMEPRSDSTPLNEHLRSPHDAAPCRVGASEGLDGLVGAFMVASGLPLQVCGKSGTGAHCCGEEMPGFCQLIHGSGSPQIKEMCGQFNRNLEAAAANGLHEALCFAGIHVTALPLANGKGKTGYLKTGHVMPAPRTSADFQEVMRQLSKAGLDHLGKQLEKAWLKVPVMEPVRYRAFVNLLTAISGHLSAAGTALEDDGGCPESSLLRKAQIYIERNCGKRLKLPEVAQVVGLSPNYFCRKFHDFTGLPFTVYLAGIRVANASRLLHNPNMRIKEIAYETGFSSISQFNRVFHAAMGASPSEYRRSLQISPVGF